MSGKMRLDYTREDTFLMELLDDKGKVLDTYEVTRDKFSLSLGAFQRLAGVNDRFMESSDKAPTWITYK